MFSGVVYSSLPGTRMKSRRELRINSVSERLAAEGEIHGGPLRGSG